MRKKKRRNLIIASAVIFVIILIFIAWPLAAPLFYNTEVNEGYPINSNPSSNQGEEMPNQKPEIIRMGAFKDADSFHKTSGQALVIKEGDKQYLRLEDFKTTNGPDLYVYLSKDETAAEFVNLGELKGNIGNQNYEIPNSSIIEEGYDNVLIWCEDFSTLFGYAQIK